MNTHDSTVGPSGPGGDPEPGEPPEGELEQVLAEYLLAREAGNAPDQEAFIARHPGLAAELRAFFADEAGVEGVARPFRAFDANDSGRSGGGGGLGGHAGGGPPRVRYFGEYELLEEVGRGGMGVVYRARQVRLNRVVALKMILAGQFASAEDVKRFQVEAENAARLDHPHIVPIYEVGRHRGQHYFSMKYVEGGSLAGQVGRFAKDHRAAADLIATVARAVHHAHQRGILHRDLKPGNVLIGPDGQPQVTDFGLARRMDAEGDGGATAGLTLTGAVLGSPRYMAPEQARGDKGLTVAADVYSLGAVLYELLTGVPPFGADTVLETLRQVREQEPTRPSLVRPGISRDLETVCLTCLRKESGGRYASAEALAEDLERWLAGEPIKARRAGRCERAWRWCRRNPAAASLAAVSAAALVAVIASLAVSNARTERARLAVVAAASQLSVQQAETSRALARETRTAGDLRGALARERRAAYVRGVWLAERHLQLGHLKRAAQALDEVDVPELRGWEWHYLQRQCRRDLMTLMWSGGGGSPTSVAFSPDGSRLAAGGGGIDAYGNGGAVRVWDADTGEELLSLAGHAGGTYKVAFSPDGRLLASCGEDGALRLWDLALARERWSAQYPGADARAIGVAFSPDGRHVASTAGKGAGVTVRDVADGGEVLTVPTPRSGHTSSVAYSPDGRRIVIAGQNGAVTVLDAVTGEQRLSIEAHEGYAYTAMFSPDGKRIASCGLDGYARVWDADAGRKVASFRGHRRDVNRLAFSPDGKHVASAGGRFDADVPGDVHVWAAEDGRPLFTIGGHAKAVADVAFSPDGRRLATAGRDGAVRVWDAVAGQGPRTLSNGFASTHNAPKLSASADGALLADTRGNDVRVVEVATGKVTFSGHLPEGGIAESASLSADGTRVAAAASSGLFVWETASGREVFRRAPPEARYRTASLSPDGRRLVSCGQDGGLTVWDVDGEGEPIAVELGVVLCLAHSVDGRRVAAGTLDGHVLVLDATTATELLRVAAHERAAHGVTFSRDGRRLATAGGDGAVRVWDGSTGRSVLTIAAAHAGHAHSVVFDPAGTRLVSAGSDQVLRVWEAEDGQELLSLPVPGGDSRCQLAFDPAGRYLAGLCNTGVTLWETGGAPTRSGGSGAVAAATRAGETYVAPAGPVLDLIPLVDVTRDAVRGTWRLEQGALESDGSSPAVLALPAFEDSAAPREYDYLVEFTPDAAAPGPDTIVAQQLIGCGRPFQWGMGAEVEGRQFCGFEQIARSRDRAGRAGTVAHPLEAGRRYTSVVQVRRDSVRAYLDGRLLVERRTDYSDMAAVPEWGLPSGRVLGLGTWGRPARFHKAQIIVVTPAQSWQVAPTGLATDGPDTRPTTGGTGGP